MQNCILNINTKNNDSLEPNMTVLKFNFLS